jgi:SAM-dependent methyltransferase
MTALTDLKATHRATWAAGDYAAVAEHIDDAPPRDLLARVRPAPAADVLDVATGTGNLALHAAALGAQVTGLDLTPELLDVARSRTAAAGVAVDWVEGDAEDLPFADAAFDAVYSVFGVQFAPRHEVVARELARVLRPGGRLGLVNWTPESEIGALLKLLGGRLPKPPAYASPPPLWGSSGHVARLFADTGVELSFSTGHNPWRFPSADAFVAFMETRYGPLVKARAKLGAEGVWDEVRAEVVALFEQRNVARDGSLLIEAEYLVVAGRRAG